MQETQVQFLVWEDSTCYRATKAHVPKLLNPCSRDHKPQLLSPCTATTEAHAPRACAPQQEKPLQQVAHTLQLEKSHMQQQRPVQPKYKLIN